MRRFAGGIQQNTVVQKRAKNGNIEKTHSKEKIAIFHEISRKTTYFTES